MTKANVVVAKPKARQRIIRRWPKPFVPRRPPIEIVASELGPVIKHALPEHHGNPGRPAWRPNAIRCARFHRTNLYWPGQSLLDPLVKLVRRVGKKPPHHNCRGSASVNCMSPMRGKCECCGDQVREADQRKEHVDIGPASGEYPASGCEIASRRRRVTSKIAQFSCASQSNPG